MLQLKNNGLHWSLADVSDYLNSFSPPRGDFDPAGEWGHKYIIWINTIRSRSKSTSRGYIELRRSRSSGAGMIELQVTRSADLSGGQSQLTKAAIQCKVDRLATPVSWKVESEGVSQKDKKIRYPRFEESGVVADGQIVRTGKRTRRMKISKTYTHDWALFDAVQRLNGEQTAPLEFDMLEDFDLLRPKQRLSYHGTIEVKLGGKPTRLIGYQQLGEGILPIHYWLDEQHRLLFVTGGCRIYLFDSEIK